MSFTERLSLFSSYKKKFRLDTILYLHRISDRRMTGSPLNNLELFAKMCGNQAMPNVTLVTTMWSNVREDIGGQRENELRSEFWKDMIAKGCHVKRFEDTYKSAWDIIESASGEHHAKVLLPIQIVDNHKLLEETEAGIALRRQLQKLIKEQQEASRRLREQARRQNDEEMIEEMNRQRAETDEKIRQTIEKIRRLSVPVSRFLFGVFSNHPVSFVLLFLIFLTDLQDTPRIPGTS